MTLWQLSQEYARSADLIAGRMTRLRQQLYRRLRFAL